MSDPRELFAQEAEELISAAEEALVHLEQTPDDAELMNTLFRAVHTMKGSSGMFDYRDVVEFSHVFETVLDQYRGSNLKVTNENIGLFLECVDHISTLVNLAGEGVTQLPSDTAVYGKSLLDQLLQLVQADSKASADSNEVNDDESDISTDDEPWIILLNLGPDVLRNGMDPLSFIYYLENLGKVESVEIFDNELPLNSEMDPETCYINIQVLFKGKVNKQQIADVFEFLVDDCQILINPPQSELKELTENLAHVTDDQRIGEILCEIGAISTQELDQARQQQLKLVEDNIQKRIGEILIEMKSADPAIVKAAVKQQNTIRTNTTVRVETAKLERLFNLVGELIINNANSNRLIEALPEEEELNNTASILSHLVNEIRDTTTELRMVELNATFNRFKRVIRDLSQKAGKQIDLKIEGGSTELDKSLIEKIVDPLTHLIRNSVDHGIEDSETRTSLGKPEAGTITLKAYQASGNVIIEVKDDGKGIDAEKVRAKAIERELISADSHLSPEECYRLIFLPGFSTAQAVSEISGRGVGMDVVKKNIESIGGVISIESEPQKGSLFRFRIPLTMAIIDGFLIQVGESRYVIPLANVSECIEHDDITWKKIRNNADINLRGELLPLARLRDYFSLPKTEIWERVIVIEHLDMRVGVVVDDLLGEIQAVIKPLSKAINNQIGYSGATILSDGNIAMILDIGTIIESFLEKQAC
ncbi:chemotaxis protein CheA [Teredinibacter sp. KSP-S5-2]|uniref:chemotaxis protein CheA n=1 Tax=Teredinibacter sp. KSP-S5-2 TaxID=3034506 RepID=UPI002934933B|nr:chemotaxis protein CheA [Teredinibacter sp. KSP-S5-2]WNO08162.1 chemotaxis protein CheA [Teredinibacter sp. KSP-S5-2]